MIASETQTCFYIGLAPTYQLHLGEVGEHYIWYLYEFSEIDF